MEIHLDSGDVLSLSPEQLASLEAYLEHPQNKVPAYDPVTTVTVYVKRWETVDAWTEFHFNMLLSGVFALCPPANLDPIQAQIDKLTEQKRLASLPIKV